MTRNLWITLFLTATLGLVGCGAPSETPSDDAAPTGDAAEATAEATPPGDPAPTATVGGVVNVYSARHYDVDENLYARFTEETGVEINLIEGDSAALLERLRREGEESPADVFMAVDAGRLHQAEQEGMFQSVQSAVLEQNIPEKLRHPEGLWFGLTKRARVIVYAKDRVQANEISTYEELADPAWKGRVLIRSSSNIYNQSLVSSIISAHGEEATEEWCTGLVANLARTPQGGDRDQVRAMAAGEGDVAVSNTYYLGLMANGSDEDKAIMENVGVIFPNQGDRGTHVNISGAGVVRGAANRENAIRFLEFLTGQEAQAGFAGKNFEYPVVEGSPLDPFLEGLGSFEEDSINASVFAANNQKALMVADRCGWR